MESSEGSTMDKELQRINTQKLESKINAWREREKAKVDHKADRKMAETQSWQEEMKACNEAKSKMIEVSAEKLRKLKIEQLKNKEAQVQKTVAEKKASIEAQREKGKIAIDDKAEKYRATNTLPKTCFVGDVLNRKPPAPPPPCSQRCIDLTLQLR
ncbi:remorin-like [Herrania umbratica]|uniref:Remorin-like n=1 Tax=Herrania umbratica TaxID=108875 RepID=A0A6J1BA75_9ROSI|nr:remorin-like [Herrania umbratica]